MSIISPLVWIGSAAGIAGVLLLRRAWSLPRRSATQNGVAWAVLLAGTALALAGNGAWGLSVAALFAMGAAALLLAHAAATARPGKVRATDRKAHMLPDKGEPAEVGRRMLTFLVTVPFALATSMLVALGARSLAAFAGWAEADSNALALLLLPLLWGMLAFWLLMLPRRAQFAWLLVPAAAGLGLVWIGATA